LPRIFGTMTCVMRPLLAVACLLADAGNTAVIEENGKTTYDGCVVKQGKP
jgi:hypothetical protein